MVVSSKAEVLSRRRFLFGMLSLPLASVPLTASGSVTPSRVVSAYYKGKGQSAKHYLRWLDPLTAEMREIVLPFRGHGMQSHPSDPSRLLMFARRPGVQLIEVDLKRGTIRRQVRAPEGRHFYGHGVFSVDGRYLYTTENHYASGEGVVCVRDADSLQPLGTFSSGGIGPHDIRMLSDGQTLVVANGGILTHPDQPRQKLNLQSMDASLAYLDAAKGRVIEQHRLADPHMSIRHLAVGSDDQVVAVQQYEGKGYPNEGLVMMHRRGEQPVVPEYDHRTARRMSGYTASVALDSQNQRALVTSPRGNYLTLWDSALGEIVQTFDLYKPYGAALAPSGGQFAISTAGDGLYLMDVGDGQLNKVPDVSQGSWDNHLTWQV